MCKLCSTTSYWNVFCASFVVQSSTGKCFVQALQYKVVLGASFVVQSRTGKCFVQEYWVQALQYKVVLGSALCKLCGTK